MGSHRVNWNLMDPIKQFCFDKFPSSKYLMRKKPRELGRLKLSDLGHHNSLINRMDMANSKVLSQDS